MAFVTDIYISKNVVGLQLPSTRRRIPFIDAQRKIVRIVHLRYPSSQTMWLLLNRSPINYHVTLVFRASRALRRTKLNPNLGTLDEFQIEEAMISSSSAECADDGMH